MRTGGYITALHEMRKIPSIAEIMEHAHFLSMARYRHHAQVSCLDHSLSTAVIAFKMARSVKADHLTAARAALLHDFYLYDWHTDSPGLHGFKHPRISLENAKQYFSLNKIEEDAIKRHMWPLTPVPPRYRESLIVCMADKIASWKDYALAIQGKTSHTGQICRETGSEPCFTLRNSPFLRL